jgi:hypothetical protein
MMVNNRDLLEKIEQLNEQNLNLSNELKQIKDMMQQNNNNNVQNSNNLNESSNGNLISNVANDMLKIKGLIGQLENKMQDYISKDSNNQELSKDDVVNLILNMMDGMVDWTMDIVSTQNNQSNQLQ